MPKYVTDWLDSISKGPGGVDPHQPATFDAREWLAKTIEDPDWG